MLGVDRHVSKVPFADSCSAPKLPPVESHSMTLSDGRAMLAARRSAACQSSWRDVRYHRNGEALDDQRKFGGRHTTDQGRIYRADRETTFLVCKTVSLGDVALPRWRSVGAAHHPGSASCSRHGHDARNDGAAPTKQETAIDTTIHFRGWGRNAFQNGPADVGQGDAQ
jgi:hypothetical protein